MNELPEPVEPERLMTELFYGCHYSYSEVSAFLKIPLTTVKKRLYSARQKLKVPLQVALHDASERVRRASDGAEEEEIILVRWWSRMIRWRKRGKVPGNQEQFWLKMLYLLYSLSPMFTIEGP